MAHDFPEVWEHLVTVQGRCLRSSISHGVNILRARRSSERESSWSMDKMVVTSSRKSRISSGDRIYLGKEPNLKLRCLPRLGGRATLTMLNCIGGGGCGSKSWTGPYRAKRFDLAPMPRSYSRA